MIHTRSHRAVPGLVAIAALVLGIGEGRADPFIAIPTGGEPGSIEIVDAKTGTGVRTIHGFVESHGLAITPDGKTVLVASLAERDDGADVAKPEGVSAAEHAAHHGGGGSPADRPNPSTVSVVDLKTGETVRRIDVLGGVHHVAMAPDGRYAALTHPGAGTVSILDLAEHRLSATTRVGEDPNYAVFAPDGEQLFVSVAGEDRIAVIDTSNWQVHETIATGASPEHIAMTGDGSRLLVNLVGEEAVAVLDVGNRDVLALHNLGGALHGIDVTDAGDAVIVSVTGSDEVVRIDLADGSILTAALPPSPYHVTAARGTGKVYVSSAAEPTVSILDQTDLTVIGRIRISGIGHQMVAFATEPRTDGANQ